MIDHTDDGGQDAFVYFVKSDTILPRQVATLNAELNMYLRLSSFALAI